MIGISKIAAISTAKKRSSFEFQAVAEILYVDYKDFDSIVAELAEIGMKVASCGRVARVPTACGGCEY